MHDPLAELRDALDRTDDALLAGLVQRAALSARIGALASKGPVKIRPGREATILRRLLAQNLGHLQPQTVIRIWRELLAGSTALQGPFSLAVGASDPALIALAREQYGALTPLTTCPPADALADLRTGAATIAVLPMPAEPWWPTLLDPAALRLHVVARLPFWRSNPDASPEALVVAGAPPDPSGDDVSLVALPRTLATERMIIHGDHALAELPGFLQDGDASLPPGAIVLGAYATPMAAA